MGKTESVTWDIHSRLFNLLYVNLHLFSDEGVVALANNCLHLKSLGLYYCQNITDRAIYSLAQSRVKKQVWASVKTRYEEEGLTNLNISQCTALTPPAVQALCDSFPALHTCPGRHSLIISGCLNLTSVHCLCAVQAHRATHALAHWVWVCVLPRQFVYMTLCCFVPWLICSVEPNWIEMVGYVNGTLISSSCFIVFWYVMLPRI